MWNQFKVHFCATLYTYVESIKSTFLCYVDVYMLYHQDCTATVKLISEMEVHVKWAVFESAAIVTESHDFFPGKFPFIVLTSSGGHLLAQLFYAQPPCLSSPWKHWAIVASELMRFINPKSQVQHFFNNQKSKAKGKKQRPQKNPQNRKEGKSDLVSEVYCLREGSIKCHACLQKLWFNNL